MATPGTQIDRDVVLEQVAEIIRQLLAELGSPSLDAVHPGAHLERDLALGSLERVELMARLGQAFSLRLPDQVAAEANTVEDLVDALMLCAGEGAAAPPEPEIFSASLAHVRRHTGPPAPRSAATGMESAETLNEVLERHARSAPGQPQIYLREDPASGADHVKPVEITYGQLHERAATVARGLLARGLGPRQPVAIMLPTCREFFYTFYGVLLAGGVPVPIYPPFRADRIEEYAARQAAILRNAEARLLVTFRQAEAVARLLKPRVPSLVAVVNATRMLEEKQDPAPLQAYRPRGEDLAFLQYTSGSTGDPKGVALTHANLLANMRAIAAALEIRPDDVGTSWLPLYHDMGLIGAWLTLLYSGVPVAVMSPLAFLTRPERWLWAVHHHRGTLAAAPNFAFELCVRKIADRDIQGLDLSSWRLSLNGAEPVNPQTLDRFTERFARYGFRAEAMTPVYGLAEASLAVTVPPLGRKPRVDRIDRHTFQNEGRAVSLPADAERDSALGFVSAGRPVPRHEVQIVDTNGRPAPDRVEGRLWFRGPSAMQGYFRNPEATASILRGDGWVDSGDLAYRADGEIFITGRVKDVIIKGGRNLYPHEVEEVTSSVSGVRKGCVVAFGAPDEKSGTERLVVVAETREPAIDPQAAASIVAGITAKVSQTLGLPPDVVELLPSGSIPKTSSGKLRRNETKELFLAGKLGRRRPPMWMQVARLGAASSAHTARSGLRRALELLYGAYAAFAFVIFILPTWTLTYLAPTKKLACRITQVGTRIFFGLIGCRIRIHGCEHLRSGLPFVFVSNHGSFLDVVLILATFKLPYRFVSKIEVASWPFIGTFIRRREDFAFRREDPAERLRQAEALEACLQQGDSLFIFPEGTFIAAPGVRSFQLGAFKAAVATGRPVCPVGLRGVRELYRDKTMLPRPSSITMTICPPITPDPRASAWQEMIRLRDAAREAIGQHCGEPLL